MKPAARLRWRQIVSQAIVAGIAGGALFDLYLWATTLLPAHAGILTMWQWTASTALGRVAFTSRGFAAAGAAMHAIVSIGWAGGYAYVAAASPLANRRWIISGVVYGLIVYAIMQIILLADGNFTYPPTPNAFLNDLVAHALFFGLPVAYVVRAMEPKIS